MRKGKRYSIKPKASFALVVDGDTEVWYFQMLKRNEKSLTINIEPKIPQKKKLSEQFKKVTELAEDYTKVFWIIDFDTINSETNATPKGQKTPLQEFNEYTEKLKKKSNIVIIVNNPCLEFWFLLHFIFSTKFFPKCYDAEKELKKYLIDYEKTRRYFTKDGNDIYLKLKPSLKQAINHSNRYRKFNKSLANHGISEMHLFFDTEGIKELFDDL